MQTWIAIGAGGVSLLGAWAGLVLYPALRPADGPRELHPAAPLDVGSMVLAEELRARREVVVVDTGGWGSGPCLDLADEDGWPGLPDPVFPGHPSFPVAGEDGRVAPGASAEETGTGGVIPVPVSGECVFDADEIAGRHGWPTLAAQNRHAAAIEYELDAACEQIRAWMTESFASLRNRLEMI